MSEVTWVSGPRDAFSRPDRSGDEMPRVLRWEDPPPPSHAGRPRGRNGPMEAVAAELRRRPGEWAVLYDGRKSAASGMSSYIRTGALAPFTPSGDFDACARILGDRRIVYARYVGDGDL